MRYIILEQSIYGDIGKLFERNKPYEVRQTERGDNYITNDNDFSMLIDVLPVEYWWQDEGRVNSFAAHIKELNEVVASTTLLKKALEFKRLEHTAIEKNDARFYQGKFTATVEAYAIVKGVTWFDALMDLNKLDSGMDLSEAINNEPEAPPSLLKERVSVISYELDRLHKKVNPSKTSNIDYHFHRLAEWVKELIT